MSLTELLGHYAPLKIRRFSPHGAYLAIGDAEGGEVVLLPGGEVPSGAAVGDELRVFVHHDSAGRLIATTRPVRLTLGQVAFLRVTQCTRIGAFVDWGLQKELLVPFAEQTADLDLGDRCAIGLYVDNSGRLAGTMRVSELLSPSDRGVAWELDEWVEGEAWRNQPEIGLFVILEKEFIGLLPRSEPHRLARGEAARFRIAKILPDGKVELSLRGHAHEELAGDAQRILEVLDRGGGRDVGDRSSPEEIRAAFGLSKKAFKRAAGRLFKEGAVAIDEGGLLRRLPRPAQAPAGRPPARR